jgi:DNA-binding transcriptional LysR family regulator
MLTMPPKGRLIARKLTDYRLALYASHEYLERHGLPENRSNLTGHQFISYIEELAGFPEMMALDQIMPGAAIVFRSSSAAAQQAAVAAGLGIGMLHMFAAGEDPRLVRLLKDDVEVWRSYCLVMPTDLQRLPRVRATVDFLEEVTGMMRGKL